MALLLCISFLLLANVKISSTSDSSNQRIEEEEKTLENSDNSLNCELFEKLDENGRTVLSHISENGSIEKMQIFLQKVPQFLELLEIKDNKLYTPFLYAVEFGQIEMVKLLANAGVNIHSVEINGRGAIHLATMSSRMNKDEKIKMLEFLVKVLNLDVNNLCKENTTALELSIMRREIEIFDYLIELGASTAVTENDDNDLVWMAIHSNSLEMLKHVFSRVVKKTDEVRISWLNAVTNNNEMATFFKKEFNLVSLRFSFNKNSD